MYWVLNIVGRDVRGRTNSTCVQLCISYACIPFFEGLYVHFSPVGCRVTFRINCTNLVVCHSRFLVSTSQAYLRSETYIFPIQILHRLRDRFFYKFLLLRQIYIGYTNISFCEKLSFNTFSCTFVHFTIIIFSWYDFTSYSILLRMSISARFFHTFSICLRCIIYVPN